MKHIILLLLGVLFSNIESQISLTPGQTCGPQNTKVLDVIALKVFGGSAISAEDAPWHTVLELKKRSKPNRIVNHCGGSIVSPTVILIAAHCVWSNEPGCPEHVRNQESARECHELRDGCPDRCLRVRPEDLAVYVGVTNVNQIDRTPLKVKNIIVHPGWNKRSFNKDNLQHGHDLAMVVLESRLQFNSKVRPVCLPDKKLSLESGRDVSVNGFGNIRGNGRRFALPEHLQQGLLQIKSKASCTDHATLKDNLLGDQLCAYSPTTDSCDGDSGGGLITSVGSTPVLVGIVSFGSESCINLPGVYTNVQSHVDWIQQKFTDITANIGTPQPPGPTHQDHISTPPPPGPTLAPSGPTPQPPGPTPLPPGPTPASSGPEWRKCTSQKPCGVGGGDCADDNTCAGALICGSNNCRQFHPSAHPKMDCCVQKSKTSGSIKPPPGPASPPPGPPPGIPRQGPRPPKYRLCSYKNPCGVREGDCDGDNTCAGTLICGANNCRQFHPKAHPKMDCCVQQV